MILLLDSDNFFLFFLSSFHIVLYQIYIQYLCTISYEHPIIYEYTNEIAPTNTAFEALPEGTIDALLDPSNINSLQDILLYHVLPATNWLCDHPATTHTVFLDQIGKSTVDTFEQVDTLSTVDTVEVDNRCRPSTSRHRGRHWSTSRSTLGRHCPLVDLDTLHLLNSCDRG